MDKTKFDSVISEVIAHNKKEQINADGKGITFEDLLKACTRYKNAKIWVHYPDDANATSIPSLFSINEYSAIELKRANSIIANEQYILLSSLQPEKLVNIAPDLDKSTFGLWANDIIKTLHHDKIRGISIHHTFNKAIYLEYIPDNLKWTNTTDGHKVYSAHGATTITILMLWDIFMLTPHY